MSGEGMFRLCQFSSGEFRFGQVISVYVTLYQIPFQFRLSGLVKFLQVSSGKVRLCQFRSG